MQRIGMAPVIIGRSIRLRCPQCGKGRFTRRWFGTRSGCDVCGLVFDREHGYWTGAIYVNLITTQFLIIGGLFALVFLTNLGLWSQIVILAALAAGFPTFFYPVSRSLWLGLDHFFTGKPEQRPPVPS